jgi:hypothetical protein
MRARPILVLCLIVAALGCVALAAYIGSARFDTSLSFRFEDSVSRNWVWDATAKLQDRVSRIFYQSDAGPIPFVFTHLKRGQSTLTITAEGYEPVSVPVRLTRGANRIEKPIEMRGLEIPDLKGFVVFEQPVGGDIIAQLRPLGADGRAVQNHPCLDIRVSCRVSLQVKNGVPIQEPMDSGSARGETVFQGSIPWEWDAMPETVFRYTARISGTLIRPDPSLYRVIDYLIVVPDPRRITSKELDTLIARAAQIEKTDELKAFLDTEKGRVRYFLDTSWNAKGREQ